MGLFLLLVLFAEFSSFWLWDGEPVSLLETTKEPSLSLYRLPALLVPPRILLSLNGQILMLYNFDFLCDWHLDTDLKEFLVDISRTRQCPYLNVNWSRMFLLPHNTIQPCELNHVYSLRESTGCLQGLSIKGEILKRHPQMLHTTVVLVSILTCHQQVWHPSQVTLGFWWVLLEESNEGLVLGD